jgi:4-hydroxybenzoate polyprenyltransferase
MFEHTLFGLPWVGIAACLASRQPTPMQWLWMIAAFTGARTSGMCLNRLIDSRLDALNPRTCTRPLPSGTLSYRQVAITAFVSGALFLLSCHQLGPLVWRISLGVFFLLVVYSYAKRFTPFCHFILGLIEFFIPLMVWATLWGCIALPAYLLGAAIAAWITGIDLIYALQDVTFDRQHGIYSVPAVWGERVARIMAMGLHALSFAMLLLAGFNSSLAWPYYIGVAIVATLFCYQHMLVRDGELRRAFFNCNSCVGAVLLLFTLLAVACKG